MTFGNPIIGGNDTLVRQAMQSEGFTAGSTGWRIERDGDAEFNNVIVRGELDVTGADGSYVRAVAQGGHADVLLNPQTVPGLTWEPAEITADVDAGNVGTDNPSLTLRSPAGAGLVQSPSEIRLDGPGELDQNAISLFAASVSIREVDAGAGTLLNVVGPLFAGDTLIDGDVNLANAGNRVTRGSITAPTLAAGWSNFGGGFQTAGYVELPDHFGQLVGVVSGTPSGTVFTLPAALRPSVIQGPFSCACNNGKHCQVVVNPNGTVVTQNADVGVTWVSLANVRWPIDGF